MYTIERIKKEFKTICDGAGVACHSQIKLNSRLSRTLGRVMYNENPITKYITNDHVEFSTSFIESATDEEIWNVIAHEAAHYIAIERTHISHHHDAYFKEICKEIGTTNDGAVFKELNSSTTTKYTVTCLSCNKTIGEYQRMCKTLKNIKSCKCKLCGNTNLQVIQNY